MKSTCRVLRRSWRQILRWWSCLVWWPSCHTWRLCPPSAVPCYPAGGTVQCHVIHEGTVHHNVKQRAKLLEHIQLNSPNWSFMWCQMTFGKFSAINLITSRFTVTESEWVVHLGLLGCLLEGFQDGIHVLNVLRQDGQVHTLRVRLALHLVTCT